MCNLPTCRSQDPNDCIDCVHKEVVSIDIIANRLSLIFGGPIISPCACMGIPPCPNTACSRWWKIVMQDESIKEKAITFYMNNKSSIESGVLKLLAKRFLI